MDQKIELKICMLNMNYGKQLMNLSIIEIYEQLKKNTNDVDIILIIDCILEINNEKSQKIFRVMEMLKFELVISRDVYNALSEELMTKKIICEWKLKNAIWRHKHSIKFNKIPIQNCTLKISSDFIIPSKTIILTKLKIYDKIVNIICGQFSNDISNSELILQINKLNDFIENHYQNNEIIILGCENRLNKTMIENMIEKKWFILESNNDSTFNKNIFMIKSYPLYIDCYTYNTKYSENTTIQTELFNTMNILTVYI